MQEQEIIAAIRARNESGAQAFLRHYTPLIHYIIAPILPNPEDREECISEIAMRVWDKIELYDDARDSWTAWLTTLARRTALNRVRRDKHLANQENICDEMPDCGLSPEEVLLRTERQQMLGAALSALSGSERTLFYRKYYYRQTTLQIARELGTTERSIEGKLYRIKKKLRKILGGELNDD